MFSFIRDCVAFFPVPSWPVLGVYAALAAVLPFRLRDAMANQSVPLATHADALERELLQFRAAATPPVAPVETVQQVLPDRLGVLVAPNVVQVADLEVVVALASSAKSKIQRAKVGLRGRPLAAFRQAPRRITKSKEQQKRTIYQPRSTTNRNQRVIPKTRIVPHKPKHCFANVICLQLARPRPTLSLRLSRAA